MTYGAIVVPLADQPLERDAIEAIMHDITLQDGVEVHAATSGLTPSGIDLGSPNLPPLDLPRPALLVGPGVSAYDAGEVWHLLDHRFRIRLPLLDLPRLGNIDLDAYSHLIMVDGRYDDHLGEKEIEDLRRWLRRGGIIVAMEDAVTWVDETLRNGPEETPRGEAAPQPATEDSSEKDTESLPIKPLPYAEREANRARQLVSGAIFEVELDITHPLAYGYRRSQLPMFRGDTLLLEAVDNPYAAVARYTSAPLLSGYISDKNYALMPGTPAITSHRVGRGTVIRMVNNPNFRAFWYGTNKLFLNGLFFGQIIFQPEP
jgi:hypothetical protein